MACESLLRYATICGLTIGNCAVAGRDEIDARILRVLRDDGRISNADLAAKVGLSPSACLRRLRLLESNGTIRGYTA